MYCGFPALCLTMLQPPSSMLLSPTDWTTLLLDLVGLPCSSYRLLSTMFSMHPKLCARLGLYAVKLHIYAYYRTDVLVWRCLLGSSPTCLCRRVELRNGQPLSHSLFCWWWTSADNIEICLDTFLLVLHASSSLTKQRRTFSVVGPSLGIASVCLLPIWGRP